MDPAELIELVRSFPHLWNKKDARYSDNIATENAWKTISTILEIEVEDIQSTWKNIRDRYVRERRLCMNRPSGSAPYNVKWPYYKICIFLDDVITRRKTRGNIKKISERPSTSWQELVMEKDGTLREVEDRDEDTETLDFDESVENEMEGERNIENSNSENDESQHIGKNASQKIEMNESTLTEIKKDRNCERNNRKRKKNEFDSLILENNVKVAESVQDLVKILQKEEPANISTEDHHFGISVAASLSKIKDEKIKLKIKAEILMIIANNS